MAGRSRRIVWTTLARNGLDEVLEYIAEDSPRSAEKVLDVVLHTAQSLNALAERGQIVPELDIPSIREVFIYSYRLIYEVKKEEVQILAFLHGARDFNRWVRDKGKY